MVAPGGADRYVREQETGSVFVVDAEPLRELEGGDHALVEKDLHEFPLDPDVDRVTVSVGDKRRIFLRRGSSARRFFADPSSPDKNDETATTWMTKVERLRPGEFILGAPPGTMAERLRLDYAGSRGSLGFLEVAKLASTPAEPEGDVYVRTERTRLWTKVTRSVGEQVLGEVPSIVR
jgi:hypothetical protein